MTCRGAPRPWASVGWRAAAAVPRALQKGFGGVASFCAARALSEGSRRLASPLALPFSVSYQTRLRRVKRELVWLRFRHFLRR